MPLPISPVIICVSFEKRCRLTFCIIFDLSFLLTLDHLDLPPWEPNSLNSLNLSFMWYIVPPTIANVKSTCGKPQKGYNYTEVFLWLLKNHRPMKQIQYHCRNCKKTTIHDVLFVDKMFPRYNFATLKCGCSEPSFKVAFEKTKDNPDFNSVRALEMSGGQELSNDPVNMYSV